MMDKLPKTNQLVTQAVLDIASAESISPEELGEMVYRAAVASHERGNRRYHDWVFKIDAGVVRNMTRADIRHTVVPGKSVDLTVLDLCPFCQGEGCKRCGWIGEMYIHYEVKSKPKKR